MSDDKHKENGKPVERGAESARAKADIEEKNAQTGVGSAEKDVQASAEGESKNFTLMFIALACFAVGVVTFVLSFVIAGWEIKFIITTMVFELVCASLLNGQKRRAFSKACKVLQILCYAIMIACVAVVVIGRLTVNS